ncbi:anaerobic ribonucleoside-triphosphate reductase activating protein [Tannockella kyphosi]|uniref:anaerobic ribonucleoside-triphosphate reductase activating protein n=1 Tax=Tannockella kyphosi TaxID=2899121 RepID=UPI002013BBD3|nr:anaerobic ribonucleoside-triphosphate reductase activating protein [Tannockella kyphosi]
MNYHNITHADMLNGEGLRVVLWLAGCTHRCQGCQNPQTWDIHGGIAFDDAAKQELFDYLSQDYISGITLSGGDPLHPQLLNEVHDLIKEIKEKFPTKTIWLYTGFVFEDIRDIELIQYLDVIVDGKFELALLDPKLHWKGSSNQRVIDVQSSMNSNIIILHD